MSTYNFSFYQNTTFQTDILMQDVTGTPVNLTGMTVASSAKVAYSDAQSAFDFTVVIATPTSGQFSLTLNDSTTADIVAGDYVYDVHLTNTASGKVDRILGGVITVLPGVTA